MSLTERSQILAKIQRWSEHKLTERLILPLLKRLGFCSVEYRHGSNERGIDILCIGTDEIGDASLLAIQVKRLKFSGSATSPGHLHGTLNQISQCMEEPVKLKDGSTQLADRVWFISPYDLNATALEAAFSKLRNARSIGVKIIDGERLLALIELHAPELLGGLGDKYTLYLRRIRAELPVIREAAALRLPNTPSLLPTYVNLDLSLLSPTLAHVAYGQHSSSTDPVIQPIDSQTIAVYLSTDSEVKKALNTAAIRMSDSDLPKGWMRVCVRNVAAALRDAIVSELCQLKAGLLNDTPGNALRKALDRFNHLHRLATLPLMEFVSQAVQLNDRSQLSQDRISISIAALLESRLNFQIVGVAGAGKTTLLRVIGYEAANRKNARLPIFVPLAGLGSRQSLQGFIQTCLDRNGLSVGQRTIEKLLDAGDLLVLLDGIDEVAGRLADIANEITAFVEKYPKTQVIIATRPWAAISHAGHLHPVQLLPFTQEQVNEFFQRWFADEPRHADEIEAHVKTQPEIYSIISTPLVATIFAVVKTMGGKLPSSLIELHEERFRLLLHDWDAIKGVKRDMFNARDKRFFLRRLAFELHDDGQRFTHWSHLVKTAMANLGDIRDGQHAHAFVQELVENNNVLLQDAYGNWGLGHLQYQEFLAALEAKENPLINLASRLGNGWWANVLRFYAEMTRDITALAESALRLADGLGSDQEQAMISQLADLLQSAPNTLDSIAVHIKDRLGDRVR